MKFRFIAPIFLILGGCNAPDVENSVENSAPDVATPAPTASPKPTAISSGHRQFSVAGALYVPGADDKLHLKAVSKAVAQAQEKRFGNRTPVLNELIRLAPAYFPKGTKVLSVKQQKNFVIDLSAAFDNQDFWSQNGEKTTQLAVYALVNNVAFQNEGKGAVLPVQLLVEGRPISTLGEFDASDAIPPDWTLVAKN